jgi:hypothetical protein
MSIVHFRPAFRAIRKLLGFTVRRWPNTKGFETADGKQLCTQSFKNIEDLRQSRHMAK